MGFEFRPLSGKELPTKIKTRRLTSLLRRKTNFHEIDGAGLRHSAMYNSRNETMRLEYQKNSKRLACGKTSRNRTSTVRSLLSRHRLDYTRLKFVCNARSNPTQKPKSKAKAKPKQATRSPWPYEVDRGLKFDIGQRSGIPVPPIIWKELRTKIKRRRLTSLPRRKTDFHEIDGAGLRHSVMYNSRNEMMRLECQKSARGWLVE